MIGAMPGASAQQGLPALREELRFLAADRGAHDNGGLILDPVRGTYFHIDADTRRLLSLWPRCRTVGELVAAADLELGLVLDSGQLVALLAFLEHNGLNEEARRDGWRHLAARERAGRPGWLTWALHNYLFVRIPLLSPEHALARLAPRLSWLFSRWMALAIAAMGLFGLYLVSRQWEAFLGTFSHLFSLEGAALYVVALAIVKSLHELGHALTAARYGCRVPTMGICLMVLLPMLYTDVTDAWRLHNRRQRLAIAAAGLAVETALACIATLAWSFLPDGVARSLAFAVATTGWVLSLGMNLNPFMRFDGYYILSDLVGIENLQQRAFALGSWRLRETLFGLGAPPPEILPTATRRSMTLYAYAVWLYRLVLFVGIALLVYHVAFKLLGIVLFVVEIAVFIALPIWRELAGWWQHREAIMRSPRARLTFGALALAVLMAVVPWSGNIAIPAVIEPQGLAQLYPVRPSEVVAVSTRLGEQVTAGREIARLRSPELEHEITRTRLKRELVLLRIQRRGADPMDRADSPVLEDMLAALETKLAGLDAERRELILVAPFDGVVAEIDPNLRPGRWLQRRDLVAVVRGTNGVVARGYVREDMIARLDLHREASFVPEDLRGTTRPVRLEGIARTGVASLDIRELASHYGGPIAARPRAQAGEGRKLAPVAGQFLVTGRIDGLDAEDIARISRGTIHAAGVPESFARRAWRQVVQVLIRESGT